MHRKLYAACIGAVAILVSIAACHAGLPRPQYVEQKTSDLKPVPFPPPPARVEFVPDEPPDHDVVWIDGEWEWAGRAWAWKRGRWVVPPPNAGFSPWAAVRSNDGMLYIAAGTWRDTKGEAIAAPKAIAYGKPTAGAIVDSEGVSEHTGKSIKEDKTDDDDSSLDAGTKAEQKAEQKAVKAEKKAAKKEETKNVATDKDKDGDGIDDDQE